MNDREKLIELAVLRYLQAADGLAVSVETLWQAAGLNLRPRLVRTEFDSRMQSLQARHLVKQIYDDEELKALITVEGRAALI
jgi:hypothetical protein